VPSEPQVASQYAQIEQAAKVFGLTMLPVPLGADFKASSVLVIKSRADSLFVVDGTATSYNRKLIAEFALQNKLPAVYANNRYAEAGGLMSYGPNFEAQYRRAATYIDRIFKGTRPADLPVEQPTRFELVMNMKAARALGVPMQQSVLARADRVIE